MQQALTVITKIKPDKWKELEEVLNTIGRDIRGRRDNDILHMHKFKSIHFARWYIIYNAKSGEGQYLFFASNYDGTLQEHLDDLIDNGGAALDKIWGSCIGYPVNRQSNLQQYREDLRRFIVRNSIDYSAFYMGYRGETTQNVKRYIRVRDRIQSLLNIIKIDDEVLTNLRLFVDALPDNPTKHIQENFIVKHTRRLIKLIVFVLDLIRSILAAVIFRPIKNLLLRREPALNLVLDDSMVQEGLQTIEDVVTQNQMTVISPIKQEPFQVLRLKIVLCLINMVGKHYQNEGSLAGITTIHFARWAIIDRGRYLLFHSNYDGSWESYIGEFVDRAAVGMDLIWTSAPGYPKDGSIDIDGFKSIIRRNQYRTHVFYSAYPERTIENILNDREISKSLKRDEVENWLRLL